MTFETRVAYRVYCDGLYYGSHGYKHTSCHGSWDKSKAAYYEFTTHMMEEPQFYIRQEKPWGWLQIDNEMVCPACFKEAFGVDFRTPTDD